LHVDVRVVYFIGNILRAVAFIITKLSLVCLIKQEVQLSLENITR